VPLASLFPTPAPIESSPEALLQQVDALTQAQLDTLPFGMIQLDTNGTILQYNKTEAELAKLKPQRQIGKNFFDQVAPCTKVREFYGRFQEGVARRKLYETFGFVFKFDHGWRNVAITLMYSNKTNTVWVLISQNSVSPPPRKKL